MRRYRTIAAGLIAAILCVVTPEAEAPQGAGGGRGQGRGAAGQTNPDAKSQYSTPEERRMVNLEATVAGLDEQVKALQAELVALRRIALTREGPEERLLCGA